MSPREALAEVRKDLVAAFGESLAGQILEAAGAAALGEEPDAASFRDLVTSVCCSPRVVGMFGELGVRDKRLRWEKLV